MIAILLISLPILRTVRFTPTFDDIWTEVVLYQVALAYTNPTPMPHLSFQHLTTACVAHTDTENCITWRWALYLLRIPTLRTFSAYMMGGSVDDDDGASITDELVLRLPSEAKSNVTTMSFTESIIDLPVLEHIIGYVTNLKEFRYHCGGAVVSMDTNHNPIRMISSLLKHCSHSLEKLVMLDEHDGLDIVRIAPFVCSTSDPRVVDHSV
ncbi:hypothetical protein BCR34DRAFT_70359 [Clohesyomyces aquaticus]|uniref:F-box domain-containing protein n=1 Tax=Clohesyomyces aquaticus TaxID=1231657 RepID=A0A1Y1YZW2_9PLEO|nr:hypothetical protein BCR34DRAFT_70359 [Clohesyomyces aquaticus]